jgi:hypothetical protein
MTQTTYRYLNNDVPADRNFTDIEGPDGLLSCADILGMLTRNEATRRNAAMFLAGSEVLFSGDYDDLTCAQVRDKIEEITTELLNPPEGPVDEEATDGDASGD